MNKNLEHLEAQLRKIFEENLIRLISGNYSPRKLFDDLLQVMQNNLRDGMDGGLIAPDQFVVEVPPDDLSDWLAHQDILDEMADFLFQSGLSEGYFFLQPPHIKVSPELRELTHGYSVSARFSPQKPNLPDTAAILQSEKTDPRTEIPERAFFIVGGKENFPLEELVIDIGRHSDNDLILDEAHVSRHHAQLRAINKRYVIFDVGSTGGLFINGKQITQATLQPGDVIRIGMVNLIFVQDVTSENPTTALPVDDDLRESDDNYE
jgi:hypothetical protein